MYRPNLDYLCLNLNKLNENYKSSYCIITITVVILCEYVGSVIFVTTRYKIKLV